tara:strand:- start:7132 stop:7344 length:213 start_codon:yes stop_codon:yes gene_type:complete
MFAAMACIAVPTAGAFLGVPVTEMVVSSTTLGGGIVVYGALITVAAGSIAVWDHYVNRLQKGHWEVIQGE